MDWDTFYFEHWVETHEPGDEPTYDDFTDWLFDKADLALGDREPVTIEERRAMGDDMLYPTHNIFGEWEN